MKQILQNARSGELELADVPAPLAGPGQILVQNHYSVMSPGTDKMAMSFARKSLLGKARSRPDLVRQVVTKLRQEGPASTYRTVTSRLDAPQPLGYSSAGIVRAVGENVQRFSVGDRVACAGAGYANHAELISVPSNLAVHVPDGVDLEAASYATLGAIAMQGVRVADPTLGEVAAVIGLGLVGQITVQLLRANGCRVLGLDLDSRRVAQSLEKGAEWAYSPNEFSDGWLIAETNGVGLDLAVVTAASDTAEPLALAANLCRKKGRIAFVGAFPIELDRRVMFEKELDLRMSTSYGPGRYDRNYEEAGLDYPISYVRWTENRNLQTFLDLVASRSIDPVRLDTQKRSFSDAVSAYEELEAGSSSKLAVVFEYGTEVDDSRSLTFAPKQRRTNSTDVGVSFIGAGNYAKAVLLPILSKEGAIDRISLVTATGPSAKQTAKTFGFRGCSTEPEAVFRDPNVGFVFVTTRHDTHVEYAIEALENGKAVWLEKPASVDLAGLTRLLDSVKANQGFLTVGYNRRYSSHARRIREFFEGRRGPIKLHYRIIAPPAGPDSWLNDPKVGGGRIIGEVCHFIDLCNFLVGLPTQDVYARPVSRSEMDDTFTATLSYSDGSVATIDYLANAASELPKEYFEASADGQTARCNNFRSTRLSGRRNFTSLNQDKGQANAIAEVLDAYRENRGSPHGLDEIENVSLVTFAILKSMGSAMPVAVKAEALIGAPVLEAKQESGVL